MLNNFIIHLVSLSLLDREYLENSYNYSPSAHTQLTEQVLWIFDLPPTRSNNAKAAM